MNENTFVEDPNRPGEGINAKGQRKRLPNRDVVSPAVEVEVPTVTGVMGPNEVEGVDVDPKGSEIDLTEGTGVASDEDTDDEVEDLDDDDDELPE